MDEQLEMIEEIEELDVEEPVKNESEIVEPPKEEVKTEVSEIKEEIKEVEELKVEEKNNEVVQTEDIKEVKPKSNKGKNILTIILALLLFIDLTALVIYLIGIEKVLSFVK